ncbi:MAG: hypothetical protein HFH87_16490 [Lachnospiraceae bacterium]|nr:hypothetical protein [Lachnospiraceae bacterium]
MNLLEQCQIWHENEEHGKIIDTLEAIPEEERGQELDLELARAYNNLADPEEEEGRRMLRRAVGLMKHYEEELRDDYSWNFRMGYAYYLLDQEGTALNYFGRALELHPGDNPLINTRSEIEDLIQECRDRLSLPRFTENFRERTAKTWEAFAGKEADLRRLMDEDKKHERGDELVAVCNEILQLAFEDVSFEMGFNGEKHELILTPEGDRMKLFQLVYFRNHAPAGVLEHWNILVGRQPAENIGLRFGDWEISGDDMRIWIERQGEEGVGLNAYCEKLHNAPGVDENQMWWMLVTLVDQILGEIPHMRYVDSFEVLDRPGEEPSVLLSELPQKLRGMGLNLSIGPEELLALYNGYHMEPDNDPDADWRMDVIAGSTCCVPILNEYLNGEKGYMDALHGDGAVAGFLCYPVDGFTGENRSQQIFDFRDSLEAVLEQQAGADAMTFIGGATGIYYGYVDFIAWDLPTVLTAARVFFEESTLPWAGFHTFRRDAMSVTLVNREDKTGEG